MRTTLWSRSVTAVAALAIGSAALAATPAAAAPAGVTKESAMLAINGFRAGPVPGGSGRVQLEATIAARNILAASCDLSPGDVVDDLLVEPATQRAVVDGMLAAATIVDARGDDVRTCIIGVTVATFAGEQLTGSATVSADVYVGRAATPTRRTVQSGLSGDVAVTAPLSVPVSDTVGQAMLSASGSRVVQQTKSTTTYVTKTAAQKKAAKKAYTKRLAAAKKSFTKATKKAGNSKSKKAAAKKAYARQKRTATVTYQRARARTVVPGTRIVTQYRPFAIVTPWAR